jgi:enoyl-CoA hydratase/carnithine racemase
VINARESGDVLCEQRGRVLLITLSRPDALNALTVEMDNAYREILLEADRDPDVRAIVVTGAGRAFCAGADVAALEALVEDPDRRHFGVEFHAPLLVDKPVIAAVNGGCVGLGFVAALFCDVRIVADEAKIGTAFAQRGVVAEHGSAFLLSRIVGDGNARDLLLSARLIRGAEALRMGLATLSVPRGRVLDEALAYADQIASTCAPWSIAVMKRQLRTSFYEAYQRDAALAQEFLRSAFRGPAFAEGVRSYREHREPAFDGMSNGAPGPTYSSFQ